GPGVADGPHQHQPGHLAADGEVQQGQGDAADPRARGGQAVEVVEEPLADAQDHQQGEAVNLDVAQGGLPGGDQAEQLFAVGRGQGGGQVDALENGLDDEPGQCVDDVPVVKRQRFAGPPPGLDDHQGKEGDGHHFDGRGADGGPGQPRQRGGEGFEDGAAGQPGEQEPQGGVGQARVGE